MAGWRVVVLDAVGTITEFLRQALGEEAANVRAVTDWSQARSIASAGGADVVLVSMCLPPDGSYEELQRLVARLRPVPVVVLGGCTTTMLAAQFLFPDAADILPYPLPPALLRDRIADALAEAGDRRPAPPCSDIVGDSPAMQRVYAALGEVVESDSTVLLEGETGTGKELVARNIHERSSRAGKPFVVINCAALPETLLEAELFGHARGAFTGAHRHRAGLFEAAEGGTLFLDEIADAPTALQVRLLRVLQEREVRRVGEVRTRSVDIRVICATQRNLAEEVAKGRFRPDLFYRLKVFRIVLPPLRERREDIPRLAEHALRALGGGRHLSPLTVEALTVQPWPGNVRELWAAVEASALRAPGGVIGLEHLPEDLRSSWMEKTVAARPRAGGMASARATLEAVLEETGGNRTRAAGVLGVSRTTLWRMMKREGL